MISVRLLECLTPIMWKMDVITAGAGCLKTKGTICDSFSPLSEGRDVYKRQPMICAEILEEVSEYTQAIRKSCEILERYGMVTGEYYRGIIDNIGEYGGYFYLGEGVCLSLIHI